MNQTKEEFKARFADISSEYLIEKRAHGFELAEEAHAAIEEIFTERGETLPPRPKAPIFIADTKASGSGHTFIVIAAAGIMLLGGELLTRILTHGWSRLVTIAVVILFLVITWIRKLSLTKAEREKEEDERDAERDGLNEIMTCAAKGDLERIRDLVSYGGNVNAQSFSGATALMFAVRHGHLPIVDFLLTSGADPRLTNEKKLTAIEIARRSNNQAIIARLSQASV